MKTVSLDCLKDIEYEALSDEDFVKFRNEQEEKDNRPYKSTVITEDMVKVFDYIQMLSEDMSLYYPQFNNGTIAFFSYDGNMYFSFYFQQQGSLSIKKGDFLTQEIIDEEGFTFEEWASDMMVYYYLDLDTKTVKSLWDNKEYIIKENV